MALAQLCHPKILLFRKKTSTSNSCSVNYYSKEEHYNVRYV